MEMHHVLNSYLEYYNTQTISEIENQIEIVQPNTLKRLPIIHTIAVLARHDWL